MKTCYRYYLFNPLKDHYEDKGDRTIVKIDIHGKKNNYELALIGENNIPEMIRIATYGLEDENLPDSALATIQEIKEHFLSIFMINYDRELTFSKIVLWNYIDEEKPPELNIRIGTENTQGQVNPEQFTKEFSNFWNERHTVKLLSEAIDERLSLNYRFLSLYRILEIIYKKYGIWSNEYRDLLMEYEERYHSIKQTGRPLEVYIEVMRNRCAHGRMNSRKKDEMGLTQLDNKGLIELEKLRPLMSEIVIAAINKKLAGLAKFITMNNNADNFS
jgi:hypothetical protein